MLRGAVLVLSFPFLVVLLSTRIAFTEAFLEWVYSKEEFPQDIFGMPKERRLEIAKLGLRSVLSDEGMREFKESGLFNEREIAHMEDVKALLGVSFKVLYLGIPLWLVLFLSLRDPRVMGKLLFFSSLLTEVLLVALLLVSLLAYHWAFEAFHLLLFDPYSWRFRDEDMLLRVYPMELWFTGTVFVFVLSMVISSSFGALGLLMWRGWKTKAHLSD